MMTFAFYVFSYPGKMIDNACMNDRVTVFFE